MCFIFQNLTFAKYLDRDPVRKKNGKTRFCSSKPNVNSNFLTQRLCAFSLFMHISDSHKYLFSNNGLSQIAPSLHAKLN